MCLNLKVDNNLDEIGTLLQRPITNGNGPAEGSNTMVRMASAAHVSAAANSRDKSIDKRTTMQPLAATTRRVLYSAELQCDFVAGVLNVADRFSCFFTH